MRCAYDIEVAVRCQDEIGLPRAILTDILAATKGSEKVSETQDNTDL